MSVLKFCECLGNLKHLKRTGWVRCEIPEPETVASHMYRMGVLSFLLNSSDGLDISKCIKMSLVHDIAESIVGDITPHCGIPNADKFNMEKEAIEKIATMVPPEVGRELVALWTEYEEGNTKEAKSVKDLDKFDMIVQAFEYEKTTGKPGSLQQFFTSTKDWFQTEQVKQWVAELNSVRNDHNEQHGGPKEESVAQSL